MTWSHDLAQQSLLYQVQQSLPNWPTIYKFASRNLFYYQTTFLNHISRSSCKAPISWGQENTHLPLRTCFPTRKWPTRKWSTVQTQLELQECMCPRPRRSASIPLNPVLGPPIPANLGIFLGQDALHMLSCLPFAAKFQPERY